MNQQGAAFLMLLLPIIKIGITIWAGYRAKELNRNIVGWIIFTLFLTLPAFIILLCLDKKEDKLKKKTNITPISEKIADKIQFINLKAFNQHLINKNWVLLRESENHRQVYIFQKDQTLLISQAGEVDKGRWEEVGDNSILIEVGNKSTLYKPNHETEHLLILKVDGKEEYLHFVDEKLYEEGYRTISKISELTSSANNSNEVKENDMSTGLVGSFIFFIIAMGIGTLLAIILSSK